MINAFRQIRLTNSLLTVTGTGLLQVGSEQVVYKSQTGVLAEQAYVNSVSGVIDTRLQSSGSFLLSQIAASSAGVSQLNSLTGALTLTGAGNITVTTGAGIIRISGDTSNLATAANLASTGATLAAWTGLSSSLYYSATNPSGYIMSSQTGQFAAAGLTGNFITNSQTGAFVDTGKFLATGNLFAVYTGRYQSFTTSISPTGLDNYFIQFPINFSLAPRVVTQVEVTGDILYSVAVRSRTVSGYTAIFSDIISESGVTLNTMASLN